MRQLKDSGIEWLGQVPKCWELRRLQYILCERNEKNIPVKTSEILSLTASQGVIPHAEKEGGGNKPKEDLSAYKLAYPDDIVMNSMNVLSGAVGLSKYYGCVSPVYYMLYSDDENIDIRFYNYMFKTKAFQRSLMGLGNGILIKESDNGTLNTIRMRIPMEKLSKLNFVVPSITEQRTIVDFLDEKIPEVDAIISKTKESIELYKKYKQAIITEAVTKGLDTCVPMKDSEVEWIGSIPKSWNVWRLKYLLKEPMQYGANESGIPFEEMLPRYIRITDITSDNQLKDIGKLSLTEDMAKGYILNDGDILFARSGGTVGKSFIYKAEYGKCAFAGYLIKATIDKHVLPKFVYYYTLTKSYDSWKNRIFIQSTIQNIGADKYSNMEIVVPNTIEEQVEIIKYLDARCAEIDVLIAKKEAFVEEMESYKQSLIYEYVTGKKEVL